MNDLKRIPSHSWPLKGLHGMLVFLLATAPLAPFRYLMLDGMPTPVVLLVRHFPTVICLLAGAVWLFWRRGYLVERFRLMPLGHVVLGMFVVGVLSCLGAVYPGASLAREAYYFLTGGMLFLIVGDVYAENKRAERLVVLFVATGYLVALYGILEFLLGASPVYGAVFNVENEVYLRLSPDPWFESRILSSIGHPVFLGAYLVLVLPLSIGFVFQEKNRICQVGYLFGTLALFVALVLTFTRGAWLGALVSALVYLKRRGLRVRWYGIAVAAVFCLLVGALLHFTGRTDILEDRVRDAYEMYVLNFSATSRGTALGHVVEMVERSPLLGVGTGMYRFQAYALREVAWPPTLDTPDNMYLLRFAEHGVLGMCAMALFLVHLFRLVSRNGAVDDRHREMTLAFEASFAGFFVDLLTCSAWAFPMMRLVFWMMAGIGVRAGRKAG